MDLAEFLERYSEDDNQWWRLDVGDMQNLFDASVQQVAELSAEVTRLRNKLDASRDLLRIRAMARQRRGLPGDDMSKSYRTTAQAPILIKGAVWRVSNHLQELGIRASDAALSAHEFAAEWRRLGLDEVDEE